MFRSSYYKQGLKKDTDENHLKLSRYHMHSTTFWKYAKMNILNFLLSSLLELLTIPSPTLALQTLDNIA